ncbi:hypothetical protein MRX96_054502 [Rhipicephalus microplus]
MRGPTRSGHRGSSEMIETARGSLGLFRKADICCDVNDGGVRGSPDAKRLYDDLISRYNKLVRPVVNDTDALTVRIKLKLSQLIEVVGAKFMRLQCSVLV